MTQAERQLIRQAQQGDARAFEALVEKYDRRILGLAYSMAGSQADAEDIAQEALIKAYQNLPAFRMESNFFTWLYRILVNTALTHKKRESRKKAVSIETIQSRKASNWDISADSESPEDHLLNTELESEVYTVLETPPMMQSVVFILRFFEEFKLKEIAEITGCTEGTVKNTLFRSVQKMRKALQNYRA